MTPKSPEPTAEAAQAVLNAEPTAPVFFPPPPTIPLPAIPALVLLPASREARPHLPNQEELPLLADADTELQNLSDYATLFGKAAPSQAALVQTFQAAYRWTSLRIALAAWTQYAKAQEATAWVVTRALFARFRPVFDLAAKADPSVAARNSALATLLRVRSAITSRGAVTKRANSEKEARGEQPYAGEVGKERKARAGRAALAAQQAGAPARQAEVHGPAASDMLDGPGIHRDVGQTGQANTP